MEQEEQVICTISKYKIHISNQDLMTQKEKLKGLFQPKMNMVKNSSQKKRKERKVRKIWVESSIYYFNSKNLFQIMAGFDSWIKNIIY